MIAPATNFAYRLSQENEFRNKANLFVKEVFVDNGCTILYQNITSKKGERTIELAFLERRFDVQAIDSIKSILPQRGLEDTSLEIKQNLNELTTTDLADIVERINIDAKKVQQIEDQILTLSTKRYDANLQILKELNAIDSTISSISFGRLPEISFVNKSTMKLDTIFNVRIKHFLNSTDQKTALELAPFLEARLLVDSVSIHFVD